MNKISIIIPTLKDNVEYLKTTIGSIKKYSTLQHEIIVVINDIKINEVPKEILDIQDIKLISMEEKGQCIAVNGGVNVASSEYILVSDDDVVFSPNWEDLTEKIKEVDFLSGNFMENEKKGGAAAPFIRNDCGNLPEEFNWKKWEKDSVEMREEKWENGFGFPFVCKKELWQRIGGYDILYDPFGSQCDSDLCYSLMLTGIMPKRWRGVLTYHFAQVSGIFWKKEAEPYLQRNRSYFERKWGIGRAPSPQIWYCEFGIPLDNLRYKPIYADLSENNKNLISSEIFNKCVECNRCRFYYLDHRNDKCPKCELNKNAQNI